MVISAKKFTIREISYEYFSKKENIDKIIKSEEHYLKLHSANKRKRLHLYDNEYCIVRDQSDGQFIKPVAHYTLMTCERIPMVKPGIVLFFNKLVKNRFKTEKLGDAPPLDVFFRRGFVKGWLAQDWNIYYDLHVISFVFYTSASIDKDKFEFLNKDIVSHMLRNRKQFLNSYQTDSNFARLMYSNFSVQNIEYETNNNNYYFDYDPDKIPDFSELLDPTHKRFEPLLLTV